MPESPLNLIWQTVPLSPLFTFVMMGAGSLTTNGNGLDTRPSGLVTVTWYVPGGAKDETSTVEVIDVGETTVQPGELTPEVLVNDNVAPFWKPVPVKSNVTLDVPTYN